MDYGICDDGMEHEVDEDPDGSMFCVVCGKDQEEWEDE